MKYMAIIDANEKPVSCEFIGCNGNVAPYLIGATTDIKALEQEPILDKIRAEIETKYGHCKLCEFDSDYDGVYTDIGDIADILQILDKYKVEREG